MRISLNPRRARAAGLAATLAAGLAAGLAAAPGLADIPRTPAPEGAEVYVISPADGAVVSGPVRVLFGARGIGIAPAGVEWEKTGHHHLLVNADVDTIAMDESLPATDAIRHFGGGQTEATIELAPGTYTLRLLLADHNHIPHDPPILSAPVTVTVE
jgi:hypothetical protein